MGLFNSISIFSDLFLISFIIFSSCVCVIVFCFCVYLFFFLCGWLAVTSFISVCLFTIFLLWLPIGCSSCRCLLCSTYYFTGFCFCFVLFIICFCFSFVTSAPAKNWGFVLCHYSCGMLVDLSCCFFAFLLVRYNFGRWWELCKTWLTNTVCNCM